MWILLWVLPLSTTTSKPYSDVNITVSTTLKYYYKQAL